MHKQIHLNPNQEEKLRELGAYLREIRLKQSLSLHELEDKTRIKARVLMAIEEGKGENLPEPIYVRALIQQFADALGLEGRDFASAFPIDPKIKGIQTSWKPLRRYQVRLFPWYLAYTLVLVCAMSGVSLVVSRSGENLAQSPTSETEENGNSETPAIAETATTSPTSSRQSVASPTTTKPRTQENIASPETTRETTVRAVSDRPTEPKAPVVVSMTLQDDCWLKVVADGKIVYQGTLAKGEQKTWHAQEQITVVAGNAGGVVVAINNQEAKPLGTLGAVETATFVPPKSPS